MSENFADPSIVHNLTAHEISLFTHLLEMLIFFMRNHVYRSKFFIASETLSARVGQLLACRSKPMKLTALKFFRTCLAMGDDFYYQQMQDNHIFGLILDIVHETMPKDNLLNSACLELFNFVNHETVKPVISHLYEHYKSRMEEITYVDIFSHLLLRYEQAHSASYGNNSLEGNTLLSQTDDESSSLRGHLTNGTTRWHTSGVKEMDPREEEYFNTSDSDEDELTTTSSKTRSALPHLPNGTTSKPPTAPLMKPLVDYPDEEDSDDSSSLNLDPNRPTLFGDLPSALPPARDTTNNSSSDPPSAATTAPTSSSQSTSPQISPMRLPPQKRVREDDDDDELGKLTVQKKRGSSVSSVASSGGSVSTKSESSSEGGRVPVGVGATGFGKRGVKKGLAEKKDAGTLSKKISIALGAKGKDNATKDGGKEGGAD
jgi:protein phosphatase-4 regulatory subunit 3